MRTLVIATLAVLALAANARSQAAFTPPSVQIANNGHLSYAQAIGHYTEAAKACAADPGVRTKAAYLDCLNNRLKKYDLVATLE